MNTIKNLTYNKICANINLAIAKNFSRSKKTRSVHLVFFVANHQNALQLSKLHTMLAIL